jgi:hypothetical protein
MLVRGEDCYNHFHTEQRVGDAVSPEAYENHRELMERFRARQDAGAEIGREVAYSEIS